MPRPYPYPLRLVLRTQPRSELRGSGSALRLVLCTQPRSELQGGSLDVLTAPRLG